MKTVSYLICSEPDCQEIIKRPEDGFVLHGKIETAQHDEARRKPLAGTGFTPVAICRHCLMAQLTKR